MLCTCINAYMNKSSHVVKVDARVVGYGEQLGYICHTGLSQPQRSGKVWVGVSISGIQYHTWTMIEKYPFKSARLSYKLVVYNIALGRWLL